MSGGWSVFTAPKPALILVSSAATERNALFADSDKRDDEARKADIPIVQLNPGGVLNYKYAGEQAVRALGLPYTVIRPVGERWLQLIRHAPLASCWMCPATRGILSVGVFCLLQSSAICSGAAWRNRGCALHAAEVKLVIVLRLAQLA